MFEFLFKYPPAVFLKGTLVLLSSWPRWILFSASLALVAVLALVFWQRRRSFSPRLQAVRAGVLWLLQSSLLVLLLLLLWEPAISVTALQPQTNIVAVVIDDSSSMSLKDVGASRQQQAIDVLNGGLLKNLQTRFQVRLYRLGSGIERIPGMTGLHADQPATQIGQGLRQLADDAATLPIGAVVLLSDGADNTGGVDFETLSELRRRRLPVNAIGFGRQQLANDVEVDGLDVPDKALNGSRLEAEVTIRQNGFEGKVARLVLTSAGSVVATKQVTLQQAPEQVETVEFNAGKAGVKNIEARLDPLPGEENPSNNYATRVLAVDNATRRLLYVEGEPRWEFKFIRRAADDDPALQVVSMLRTTQNKIYRQGISSPMELADGFPTKPEDLFEYQGLILGSIESAFFTPVQQQLIKDFVDRRGGGLLFLGGRWGLSDGGYNVPPFIELLPVTLPPGKNNFQRTFGAAELTDAGKRSLICRIEDDPQKSADHWEVLPYLANYENAGRPKPGAVVLANVAAGGRLPLLVTENYGRGRTAVFATGGSWRWRMQQPVGDTSQETFWRQLLRWTAGATPSRVVASASTHVLEDNGRLQLRAEVRDLSYLPAADAEVRAHVVAPDGTAEDIPLHPEPLAQGIYVADSNASQAGSYIAQITARRGSQDLGGDVTTFRRENGVAENFHREQNKELLQKLADETGGRYYTPSDAYRLPQEIAYSEAGITAHEMKDLWNMPAVFLLALALKSAEWLLRRRWGAV
ncbi:MAG: hypothetical protein JOY54_11710 [Acidobacteriaceae bacterium]|nr:hypothetical protein [Acidobacteriaceae bacterium]